jgi:hypothetical protein
MATPFTGRRRSVLAALRLFAPLSLFGRRE